MSSAVLSAATAASFRQSCAGFEPELLSGADCAALAEELAATEKACGAARLLAAARAVACGAHQARGFNDGAAWMARQVGGTTGQARQALPFIADQAIGQPGDWRMLPLRANGQLAAAAYHLGNDGAYYAFAIVVLATTSAHITRISLFADPALFPRFDLPPRAH